jgi:hypothetical protein
MSAGGTISNLAIAAVGGIGAILAIVRDYPLWITIPCLLVIAVAMIVAVWNVFRPSSEPGLPAPAPPSATRFIAGDVVGSTLEDVTSDADLFVDGGVHSSRLSRILHLPKRP